MPVTLRFFRVPKPGKREAAQAAPETETATAQVRPTAAAEPAAGHAESSLNPESPPSRVETPTAQEEPAPEQSEAPIAAERQLEAAVLQQEPEGEAEVLSGAGPGDLKAQLRDLRSVLRGPTR